MKDGFTRIAFVLDRSGSMEDIEEATVAGANAFIDGQKTVPGTATIKMVQFDDVYEVMFDTPIDEAPELTLAIHPKKGQVRFKPRGSTALRDAIGRTITELGADLAKMDEADRPSMVIVVIMTDGKENASTLFSMAQINTMIAEQRDKYHWEFRFLAANQDAIATAADYNIGAAHAMTYSANWVATANAMHATTDNVRATRMSGKSVGYTVGQRAAAVVEDEPPATK